VETGTRKCSGNFTALCWQLWATKWLSEHLGQWQAQVRPSKGLLDQCASLVRSDLMCLDISKNISSLRKTCLFFAYWTAI
jgi:hypothetical protein